MQLDQNRIVIRERSAVEVWDLTLQVCKAYFGPLLATFALGAAPFIALNFWLVGQQINYDPLELDFDEELALMCRHAWTMGVLVFVEAPLASVFATSYLGQAVFHERPQIKLIVRDVLGMSGRLAWCHLVVRAVAPVIGLLVIVWADGGAFNPFIELVCLGGIGFYLVFLRGMRPFINEIILLERNPLRAKSGREITISKRSTALHGLSSGELFLRWMGTLVLVLLAISVVFQTIVFLQGVFLNVWHTNRWTLWIVYPLTLWSVASVVSVYRFLSYLDLRIRQEGWEVELHLRAEASRLDGQPKTAA